MALYPLNGLALCAGAGGLELGLHIADSRYRPVCYVEQDSRAAAALVARMADQTLDQAPIWDDLATFDGRPWRGCVDILSAGYPCQPFSQAGHRLGTADPRHLWPQVARIVAECAPARIVLENVTGHLSLGFDVVARDLQGLGFRVAAGVFSARGVGASHYRRRLFILADADRDADRHPARDRDWAGHHPLSEADQPVPPLAGGGILVPAVGFDRGGRVAAEPSAIPLFAPGPGDLDAWRRLLTADPGLKPALHRDADGMADWVDRSRLAGNGVCSLAAAYAYRTLDAALAG